MKKTSRGILAVLIVAVSAVCAWGAAAPLVINHTLTGYSMGEQSVTLEYAVQVQNQEDGSLGPVSLTLVPHPPFVKTKSSITVDSIGPKGTATFTVKFVTPLLLEQDFFSKKPLLWACKYTARDGRVVEFPVKSRPGGAK